MLNTSLALPPSGLEFLQQTDATGHRKDARFLKDDLSKPAVGEIGSSGKAGAVERARHLLRHGCELCRYLIAADLLRLLPRSEFNSANAVRSYVTWQRREAAAV